jgi:hypothetical protein
MAFVMQFTNQALHSGQISKVLSRPVMIAKFALFTLFQTNEPARLRQYPDFHHRNRNSNKPNTSLPDVAAVGADKVQFLA